MVLLLPETAHLPNIRAAKAGKLPRSINSPDRKKRKNKEINSKYDFLQANKEDLLPLKEKKNLLGEKEVSDTKQQQSC